MSWKLLDFFCKAGGCSMGYHKAGFEVTGCDIEPQKHYPFNIIQGDAMQILKERHKDFDAFHASPPCQGYSSTKSLQGNKHPMLIEPVREAFQDIGKPWVIENVPGAPLKNATLLCGLMFNLNLYRHRLFESNVILDFILHPGHHAPLVDLGRKAGPHQIMQIVGHFTDVARAQKEMECPWMNQHELAQAIPPAYTEWIGKQLIEVLENEAVERRLTKQGVSTVE